MKKVIVILLALLLASSFLAANPLEFETHGEPFDESLTLCMYWDYDPELYYRFKFSDVYFSKDGNFEGVFDTESLDTITMSTLKANRLWNDKNIYVYWQVDQLSPISKLTLEMPRPLLRDGTDVLDWYTSIDNDTVMGGNNGYGVANAVTVFERRPGDVGQQMKDSVQLSMWTDDITGKKAGDYTGYLILRVFGEI